MGDLRFALTIIITMIEGYFNRDDSFAELLERYNDDFPLESEIQHRFNVVTGFIEECAFSPKLRVWKKADLFTLIIELDRILNLMNRDIQPQDAVSNIEGFFLRIDEVSVDDTSLPGVYYKAALQASNDRLNRVRRGAIIEGVLVGDRDQDIFEKLRGQRLVG